MPHLMTNGVRTHYKRTSPEGAGRGASPTVVFVHGLGTDSLASFYLTLAAPLVGAGVEVIAYDLRGHGRSDRPVNGYAVDDFTDDLGALLDGLDVAVPVYLAGNSFGGTVAFAFAHRHPERVAGLVAIEAEPPTGVWSRKMTELLAATMEFLDREDTYEWIRANPGSHQARLARLAGERLRATGMVPQIPTGRLLSVEDLSTITCPVLNVVGDIGYQADDPYLLQSLLPHCETVVLAGQDHSVLVEAHRTVRELLLRWIAENPVGTAGDAAESGTGPGSAPRPAR